MKTVTIHDAKTNLSKYIAAAKNGEKIYIGGFGKPEVQLKVVPAQKESGKRPLGLLKGKIWVAPDAFSEETDKEIADLMLHVDDDLGV
ncbi:MAG: type II toxin-antitoxin system Phd/YefM family antitoxin [Candidatus Saccharimonadales bacterium]